MKSIINSDFKSFILKGHIIIGYYFNILDFLKEHIIIGDYFNILGFVKVFGKLK